MFNETHLYNDKNLTFIKSANIIAYPCGRRRSTSVDEDGSDMTVEDQYYIPFDPEARLSTEKNIRRHSGLNGYTQTYLKNWNDGGELLELSLAGYLFNITLTTGYSYNSFGNAVIDRVSPATPVSDPQDGDKQYIYANILIEDTHLFSGFQEYYTEMLRDQSTAGDPQTSLDLLRTLAGTETQNANELSKNFANYYFSGLSFSIDPLAEETTEAYNQTTTYREKTVGGSFEPIQIKQTLVSLRFLERTYSEAEGWSDWQINEPARLPNIKHGETEDSIVVGNVSAQSIETPSVNITEKLIAKNTNADFDIDNDVTFTADIDTAKVDTTKIRETLITEKLTVKNDAAAKEAEKAQADIEILNADKATIGELAVTSNIGAASITANEFTQSGSPVPTIDLVEQNDGYWQLQFSRISIIEKQN